MRLFRRRPKPPKPQPLRRGILHADIAGAGLLNKGYSAQAQIEVSEWEVVGHLSRVTVDNVSGVPFGYIHRVADLVPRWVPSNEVLWMPSR